MRKHRLSAAAGLLLVAGVFQATSFAAPALDAAQVSEIPGPGRDIQETVWFQGYLAHDTTGEPVDATYTVTASIYDADVAGASVWGPESHVGTGISGGWFNIELGNVIGGLPAFDTPPYYLELTINGEIMSPRLKLASVPSAFQSLGADNGLSLPYHAFYNGEEAAFRIQNDALGHTAYFEAQNPSSGGAAILATHVGTGPAVRAVHDGTGPAILAIHDTGGNAAEFLGDVEVTGGMHVTEPSLFDSALVANRLTVSREFVFAEGASEGYVLTCDDAWGAASWQPLPTPPPMPFVVEHSEETEVAIAATWTQYDDCQVTLAVPAPGWIVVESSVWIRLNHESGTRDRVFVAISEYPDQAPADAAAHNSWEIPESWPTGGEAGMTLYPHNTFFVPSSGTYTYYLVGTMFLGQDPLDLFTYAHMRGIYYPEAP